MGNALTDHYGQKGRKSVISPFLLLFYAPPVQRTALTLLQPASKSSWGSLTPLSGFSPSAALSRAGDGQRLNVKANKLLVSSQSSIFHEVLSS